MSKHIAILVSICLILLTVFFLFRTSVSGANTQLLQPIPTISPTNTPTVTPTTQPTSTPAISLNIELPKKQILKATYSQGKGLEPTEFTVKTGIPVRFEVYAEIDGVGCMGSIMIPYLSNSVQQFIPLRENLERKLVDESEDFSLRRDSAPDEAWGEDTPTIRSGSFIKGQTNIFEFTPEKPGEYEITCAMGIPHGSIIAN